MKFKSDVDVEAALAVSGAGTFGGDASVTGTLYGSSTNFSGSGDYAGSMTLGTGASTAEANLQIGHGRTGNGYSYVDLIGDATYTDYGFRIIRGNSGANATSQIIHRGTGNFSLTTTDTANMAFTTGGVERMRITSGGNVGIGTTSPVTPLQISTSTNVITPLLTLHNSTATNGGVAGTSIDFIGSSDTTAVGARIISTRVASGAHMDLRFHTQRDQFAMIIDTSGNVGIGTTNPTTPLHVYGIAQIVESGNTAFYGGNYVRMFGTQSYEFRNTGGSTVAQISLNGNSYFNGGNVGIGTTSPQKELDVYLGTSSAVASIGGTISAGEYAGLHFGYSETGNSLYRHSAIVFERDDAGFGDARGKIHLLNSPSGSASADLGDARLTILPAGNVGIGTTAPQDILVVANSVGETRFGGSNGRTLSARHSNGNLANFDFLAVQTYFNSDFLIAGGKKISTANGVTDNLYLTTTDASKAIYTDRKIAIGTTAPGIVHGVSYGTTQLHIDGGTDRGQIVVEGDVSASLVFSDNGGVTNEKVFSTFVDGGSYNIKPLNDNGTSTVGGPAITVLHGGNVGIGTTAPGYKLDVNGSIRATDYVYANDAFVGNSIVSTGNVDFAINKTTGYSILLKTAGSERMRINGQGNVGIGTTTPGYKLDVSGSLRATGESTFTNNLLFPDNSRIKIGSGNDFQIYHDGSNSYIENETGNLTIFNKQNDGDVSFASDNGSGGTTEYFRLDGGIKRTIFSQNAGFEDNARVIFGSGNDLQIYHDGSNSYITDSGTGHLNIKADNLQLLNAAGNQYYINAVSGGSVSIFNNASKRFETTSTGVTVTGAATATTFIGDLNGTINTVTTAVTKANATNDTTVATTAFVQNLIGTIPAGLVFQGTWNAATNTPTLTSGSGTTGHFYIVSTSGSTNLDGVTDWVTGDWAVFIEQGGTDAWEKIDNSSVLDGAGTGQTVALWSGSGTSNTLTDAPITVSGNDTTFAGDVTLAGGSLSISGDGSNGVTFTESGNGDFTINAPDDIRLDAGGGDIVLRAAGTEFGRISKVTNNLSITSSVTDSDILLMPNGAGNVGIGTTAPAFKLHVNSTDASDNVAYIHHNNAAQSSGDVLKVRSDAGDNTGSALLNVANNTGSALYVRGDRKVGIGTTSPQTKLQVTYTDSHVSGDLSISNSAFDIYNNSSSDVAEKGSTLTFSDNYSGTNKTTRAAIKGGTQTAGNTADGFLAFYTDSAGANSMQERMRIKSNGNVGIGAVNPGYKLEVDGGPINIVNGYSDPGSEAGYRLKFGDNGGIANDSGIGLSGSLGNESLWINKGSANGSMRFLFGTLGEKVTFKSTGNVGIGTTAPDSLLELENSPAAQSQTRMLHIDNNPTDNQGSGYMEISSGTNGTAKTQIEQVSSGGFGLLGNNYLDTVIINRALSGSAHGNIGFATGSNTSATSIVMTIGGGAQKGNVGIGTRAPQSSLQVAGGVQMANDTDAASADKVGTQRYRSDSNNSYVDMCMQTGAATYEWVNIVQNNW